MINLLIVGINALFTNVKPQGSWLHTMIIACHHHQNIIRVAWIDRHDLLVARLSRSGYGVGRLIGNVDNHGGET